MSRRSWSFLPAAVLACRAVAAGEEEPRPVYFEGLDLSLPAQEAFRAWPPDGLRERPYWLPWDTASFQRAALFSRPVVFVLTVNWNRAARRLMDETLADPRVLRAINRGFLTVAVNADVRPDVRERYQTGAWPVVTFLLPGGEPMLSRANEAGTLQPITAGAVDAEALLFLVNEAKEYWERQPAQLIDMGREWTRAEGSGLPAAGRADTAAAEAVAQWLLANADRRDGGFQAAPKFLAPGVEELAALLQARGSPALRQHSRLTLERLSGGPLFDRREGGMHRLAEEPGFGRIQYEKLLSTNTALLRELTWSLRGAASGELAAALRSTGGFVVRKLGRPGGGFYLAQGADPSSADGGGYWRGESQAAPPLDRLVLAGPNALAGAALLRAGALLDDAELAEAGRAALELVFERAYSAGRSLQHVIEPVPSTGTYLVAHADVAFAFADAYETSGERKFLIAAKQIADHALSVLADPRTAALRDHDSASARVGLLGNPRWPFVPNVRLARALLKLEQQGLGDEYRERGLRIVAAFCGDLAAYRAHAAEAALALEEAAADPLRILISGPPAAAATAELRRAALNSAWPFTLVSVGERRPETEPLAEIRWQDQRRVARDGPALRAAIAELTGAASGL